MQQFADKPFEQARKAKAEAREYALTQEYLMEQAACILKLWANRLAKTSNEDMVSVLEQRLMKILAETRDLEGVTKSQGNLRRLEDQERLMIRKNMEYGLMSVFTSTWTRQRKKYESELNAADMNSGTDYGGGHGPPWKGRAIPLVPAGEAGARGSVRLNSDCSQSEPLPNSPNCLQHARGPSDVSGLSETDLTRISDASADHPDSSVHSEGQSEK
jgi:hypothetical protein